MTDQRLFTPPPREPAPRADGRCALPACRRRRGTKLPAQQSKRARAALQTALMLDPFCSAKCCREWHQVDIAEDARAAQQQRDYDHDMALG